jgi:hypothetical protein
VFDSEMLTTNVDVALHYKHAVNTSFNFSLYNFEQKQQIVKNSNYVGTQIYY